MLQLKAIPININLIQIYAPTSETSEESIEKLHSDLDHLTWNTCTDGKYEKPVMMADINAKIGKRKVWTMLAISAWA